MKGLYLSNIDPQESIGYKQKIWGQIQGFCQLGCNMAFLGFNAASEIILAEFAPPPPGAIAPAPPPEHPLTTASRNLIARRYSLLKAALAYLDRHRPDFLYLRYPRSEPLYLAFLALLRLRFPKLLILSEYPTFPYDKEYEGPISRKDQLVFALDRTTRAFLRYGIDRAIAVNYAEPIFGVPTVAIDNGVTVANYTPIPQAPPLTPQGLQFIGVANVNPWHGYDRLLWGLGEYYRQPSPSPSPTPPVPITLHIVGAKGPYLQELQTLAETQGVSDRVLFHPAQQGNALDFLFAQCHLAIGVLGAHRKDLTVLSPLKSREYCARGIPFIFSHTDPDFPASFPYALPCPNEPIALPIAPLVDFIHQIHTDPAYPTQMRQYALTHLDWAIKLQPVITALHNLKQARR